MEIKLLIFKSNKKEALFSKYFVVDKETSLMEFNIIADSSEEYRSLKKAQHATEDLIKEISPDD